MGLQLGVHYDTLNVSIMSHKLCNSNLFQCTIMSIQFSEFLNIFTGETFKFAFQHILHIFVGFDHALSLLSPSSNAKFNVLDKV